MIGSMFGKRYADDYETLMSEEKYDLATFVACKRNLGEKRITEAAMGWYDRLLNERNPKLAYDIAVKFSLPEQYIKHAMVEELRLRAMDIEDVSYKFIENAQALRAQADDIERSMSPDRSGDDSGKSRLHHLREIGLKKDGEKVVSSCPLWSGYFFRAQDAAKKSGLGKDVFYKIGLLIFENELVLGNEKYAELIANSYRIKKEDKKIITEAVQNRKGNNTNS